MIPMHRLTPIPPGCSLADVLPVFGHCRRDLRIGTPCTLCAGCRKPFNSIRKRRKEIRLYPVSFCQVAPIAVAYSLCGKCFAQYQAGGASRDALLAAVDAFLHGDEASQ